MWNSRSPCGDESVAERQSSHCWTSWLALDKENHWWSTPAVAPDKWVQWGLHNPSICCSQSLLDPTIPTIPTICGAQSSGAKPCLIPMFAWHALYPIIILILVYRGQNFLCPSISWSVPLQGRGLYDGFCCTQTWTLRFQLLGPNNWYLQVHQLLVSCQDRVYSV